jgi:hypothetical protein
LQLAIVAVPHDAQGNSQITEVGGLMSRQGDIYAGRSSRANNLLTTNA